MTNEKSRISFKPRAVLAAFGLALALLPSSSFAVCTSSATVRQAGGGDCTSIQQCVNAVSIAPFTGDYCINVDSATYSEQVSIQGKNPGSFRLIIQTDPALIGTVTTVSPPNASFAAFRVMNSSVALLNMRVVSTNTIAYGVYASSDNVAISSINVSLAGSGGITAAGIAISSYSSVSFSSINLLNADGLQMLLGSSHNTVTHSTMTTNTASKAALYLFGSSSNTITQSYMSNPSGYGVSLVDAGYNTLSQSSILSSSTSYPALSISATGPNKAVYNLIAQSYISNPVGHAGMINFSADHNDIVQSTFSSNASIYRALEINNVSSITITQSSISNPPGYALLVSFSTGVTVAQGTMMSSALFGLYVDVSSAITVIGSNIQGNPAAYVRNSTGTVLVGDTFSAVGTSPGVQVAGGNVGFSLASSSISGIAAGKAIALNSSNGGFLGFSSNTVSGAGVGFEIAAQGLGATFSVATMTFANMAASATAVNFVSGNFVATFTGVNFADASVAVNVNGTALGAGARITMFGASGIRAGPGFENDPSGYVDWPGFGVGGLTPAPFSAVTNVALTVNWSSTFIGGTIYTAELSTGGFPNNFTGNQSFNTTNLYWIFSAVSAGTQYFARVSTNAATGPYTLLGSTVTAGGSGAGTIAPLAYTNVSANSLTANWNPTFAGGTVYYLQISTNGFATVNSTVTTTNVYFFYTGLLPALTYNVRVSTSFSGGPFTDLGSIPTPSSGGGTLNFNFSNASGGAVIASANGQNEMGLGVLIDPISGGGPYAYVLFASTPGATGARNNLHDTAGVVGLVRYGPGGTVLSSRTLAIDSDGVFARDDAGGIYVAESDKSLGPNSRRINKYSSDLNLLLNTVIVSSANVGGIGAMISTGTSIFALIEDGNDNTAKIVNYDLNLVALATAAPYNLLGGSPVRGRSMARDAVGGFLYVVVSSAVPTAPVHVLRYSASSPGVFNAATPLDMVIPGMTSQQEALIAVAAGKVYLAFTDVPGTSVIVREYNQSLGYTGVSSTITNVTAPFGKPGVALQADSVSVFVAATVNTGGGGDYLVMKYDANNGLAFVSSATFNSPTYLSDQARSLALGLPGDVYVTGASSNTIANADVMTVKFFLGTGGGQAGAVAAAPYTGVSTTSFTANWTTTFPNGTVYYLEISTDGFTSINALSTTSGVNFTYTGLSTATTYGVRVSTAISAGPFMPLGAVTTLGAGLSISGIVSYAGFEPGVIRIEAYTTAAYTGIPASSQVLSNAPSQSYYLPVGVGTYYLRAYVDVLGGRNYQTWLDQGTTGPFTLGASSFTGRNFAISVDALAPSSPLGLSASPSAGQVFLTWAVPTTSTNGSALQDLRGYIIERSTSGSFISLAGTPSAPISSSALNFIDYDPVPNVANFYRVIAVDFARNQSAPSATASVSGGSSGSGGTITGHVSSFTITGSGTYRVRLSSMPSGVFISESNQQFYSFSGLSTGTYYLRGFRDLNEDGVQGNFEPAGLFGGLHNNPFPIYVTGTNSAYADLTLCDRSLMQVGSPVSAVLQSNGCPARDAGPDRFTNLLAFEAGTGSTGSVSLGTALTISMSLINSGSMTQDSRLIVLGPGGQILADNSAPGGAAVSITPNQIGVYVVEPTSFYGFSTGAYSVTMNAGASGLGSDGISGTLSYAGGQSGNLIVRFFDNASFAGVPLATMTVAAAAGPVSALAFDKRNLPAANYFVDAYRDTSGFGFNPSYQAYGRCNGGSPVVLSVGVVSIGDCALADPAAATGGGSGSISGAISYNGSLSGTVRTSLFALGSNAPIRSSSAAFASPMPYSFTGLPAGTYLIKAFADSNNNFVPDAGEQILASPAVGIGLQANTGLTGQNFTLCDRSAIVAGVPITANWTAADCPAADRDGAFMRLYTFDGTRGQAVTIEASAINLYGTFLALYDPEGNLVATNDGGANNGDARISAFVLPSYGLYTIGASPYAPNVTGQIRLSLLGSSGALGSISGNVDYQGTQGGRIQVALFNSASFSSGSFLAGQALVSTRTFRFDNLFTGSTYYLGAFVDVNFNNNPDPGEASAYFGVAAPSPIYLGAGQDMTGASIVIAASTTSAAGAAYLTGRVSYTGGQTGQLILEFWASSQFTGQPVAVRNIPTGIVLSSATYDVSLPGGANYFVRAFLDVNGDFVPNPSEPKGVYSSSNQGAEPIYVPAGQTLVGVNVTMSDPGQMAGGVVAGEGTAVISSTYIVGGSPFSLSVVYTAGATGIQAGGQVGMTVPPNFPFPFNSPAGSSVTARSASALSAVNYSGPSVFVTLSAPLAPGATVGFEWSNVYAPCLVGSATFTVTSVSNGSAAPVPLFAGAPSVPIVSGPPAFFQLSSPYFSVKQGELSDLNYLEARDACGSKVPLTAAKTVDMRGAYYNSGSSQFTIDPDVGLTTGTAVSTASAIAVDFEVGQSSRPFFVVSASTGFKNLEVHYNLQYETTFYFGVNAMPANILSGVFVSTAVGASALSSATISIGAAGLTNQVFVGFTLGDPRQSWHVLFSSIPFRAGAPPTPLWERWGFGQPNPGEIAWDGRFNPWINGGGRVPNGLYYGRVEVGWGGVKDDTLRVAVSLPEFGGRVFDPSVTPNVPLSGARLRVYGPTGYFTAVTGDDGSYSLPGLGAGAYRLNLALANYADAAVDMTLNSAGAATAFAARSVGVAVSSNASGGLDVFLGRAPRLTVVASLDPAIAAVAFDQWGSLQVRSSTGVNSNTIYGPMRLKGGTTTFDDGGQWDPSTQQFVEKTLLAFNVPVGTYSVLADLPGYSRSTGTVFVGAAGARLDLTPFARKTVVTGQVFVSPNPNGTNVSIVALPLSSAAVNSGFSSVFLNPGTTSAMYTMGGLDAGSYILRANAQSLSAITIGPITLPASGSVTGQDFPVFGAGASIFGSITVLGGVANGTALYLNAWSPGSFNFGSTTVYTTGGIAPYAMPGLDAGATYQLYVHVQNNGGKSDYDVAGGFPMLVKPSASALNFTLSPSSGVVVGTIFLQAGATDFLNVELYGRTLAALRPENVGHTFVEISTALPGFSCGGLPASNPSSAPVAGYCPGISSATFMVTGANTETLEISFLHRTTGQSSKQILSIVNGATSTLTADLSSATFSISGSIINQISGALFNTNPKIVVNAPLIAPIGYPAGLSSTTARVTAIRQDIDAFGVAISTVFSPLTSRVGFLDAAGAFIISNVPKGVYFVRTTDLRSCATCAILVPAVGKVVSVAGASVSSVTLTLSDGYSVSGGISLDNDALDAQIFDVSVVNRRQEVVRSMTVYLGDLNQGVVANSVDYSFTNLPAGEFYTMAVRGRLFPIKYVGRPIKFPDASLSPNGLQSSLTGQNVVLQRAAYITGRLKDGGTGELIRAANASLLAPNFAITATANPWTEGGFVTAVSSVAGRPIEADGYFRVGPLVPDLSYDLRLAQATWDPNFLASGSQNYAPVTVGGLKPTAGEIRDVGVVALGQGQSLTGVVRSTTTGLTLGNIKVTARPSFGGEDLVVQTFTNQQGVYSLWVSSAVSNQFSLIAAPRDGNQANDGRYYGQVTLNNVNLQTQTSASFLLTPLSVIVTGQVVVPDAATGGALSYPFGDKRGFPAAAVNLQPIGVVTDNPLGDIETTTDQSGLFSVPGLSTGLYSLHATSLGYAVYNATVQVIGSSFRIFTGSNTPTNNLPGGLITLARGATATGRILKSDGTSPNSTEVVGVAAANFSAREFVVGSIEVDPVAKIVSAYTISGFKAGVAYDIVLLSGSKGKEVSFPSEGAGVLFGSAESTTTKTINLTYRPAALDCLASAKALDAARSQFSVQVDCLKSLRQETAADDDLSQILAVSTYTEAGTALAAPNGAGVLSSRLLSTDRRRLTATYTLAASESRFTMRVRASAAEVDPRTGDNFAVDKVFDFYAGLDAHSDGRVTNIDGGAVEMQPSAQDELLGLDERSRIDLPPGAFGEGSDSLLDSAVVAKPTTTVNVSMTKGRDQALAKALNIAARGYAPAALEVADVPSAFPAEMWAAMNRYRTSASTTAVGGANPISAFYSIFLPAGIRHQLKQRADLTLSYSLAASTSTADDKIQIWFYNAVLGRFVMESTDRRLDTVNKTVTVSVDHFSTFVVLDSTPVATSTVSFGGADIAVANFPNPADCITHSNITRNSALFGSGGVHAPFVGTMIRTSIPLSGTAADLKINIYTVAGEKIRTIEQGEVPAGQTYYTPWNCANDAGRAVASGVYIGEAVHGGRRKFFKIAIIKGSGL